MSTASQMPGKGKPTSGAVPPSVSIVWQRIKTLMCSVFDHDNSKDMDALMATPLWQAMPFVRAGRFSARSGGLVLWRDAFGNALCAYSG
mgnify:CR=1 FL=1